MHNFLILLTASAFFVAGLKLGEWRIRRLFAGLLRNEIASLSYPGVTYQVRNINRTFSGWMILSKKCELARLGRGTKSPTAEKSLFLMTAMLEVQSKRLAKEARASLEAQASSMKGINQKIATEVAQAK